MKLLNYLKRYASNAIEYSLKSNYMIPDHYQKSLNMANATIKDNILYHFHNALLLIYKDLIDEQQNLHPDLSHNDAKVRLDSFIKRFENCFEVCEHSTPIPRQNGVDDMVLNVHVKHWSADKVPSLGGIRIYNTSAEDLKGLAALQTLKYATTNLPFRGSFGTITIGDSALYTIENRRTLIESYVEHRAKHVLPSYTTDLLCPDINTSSLEMNWMADVLEEKYKDSRVNILGKTPCNGGFVDFDKSPGYAVQSVMENIFGDNEIMSSLNLKPIWGDKTFVVHGFGKVGQSIATELTAAGATCVGVQDIEESGTFNRDGLDVKSLIKYFECTKDLKNYPGGTEYQTEIILFCADIVVLAGGHKTINYFNAPQIVAKMVVEAAYGAVTPNAYKTLLARNILVAPDCYAATGYDIASFLEYLKNINGNLFRDTVNTFLKNYQKQRKVLRISDISELGTEMISEVNVLETKDLPESILLKNVISTILSIVSDEITCSVDKYNLGMDLRTACYINAIKRLFI